MGFETRDENEKIKNTSKYYFNTEFSSRGSNDTKMIGATQFLYWRHSVAVNQYAS